MNGNKIPDTDLRLPVKERFILRDILGEIIKGELPERFMNYSPIITVGDFVTNTLFQQGIIPDVSIIDGKTRRGSYSIEEIPDVEIVELKNPAGHITESSWEKIHAAIAADEKVLIDVDGEEDMLSLVCIILCPKNGIVIYGIPSEGMVVNVVNYKIKKKSWQVINNMKKVK
ncbi:MAG: GTP-dependent dephospho-CoA kinase family protein [Thermoplasmata archaeon]